MTLGRLIELYEAEQKSKQIIQLEFNIYYPNKKILNLLNYLNTIVIMAHIQEENMLHLI